MKAYITAVAHYVPPDVYDNHWFSTFLDTSDEWIRERTGIRERRFLREGATSDMIVPAAREVLAQRAMQPSDIDCIIVCTVTPDQFFPSTAANVQRKLGATNAWGFDLNAACSGFVYGLWVAAKLIEAGGARNVLLCGADKMSSIINFEDRTTCVLFGDGAGVVLLEPGDDEAYGVQDAIIRMDGEGGQYLYMPAGGSLRPPSYETVANKEHYVFQDGQTVFKAAVVGMAEVSAEIMERNGLSAETVAWLVPHQANLRIIDATARRMGLSKDKVMVNIDRYGNTTAATIPICLSELYQAGKLHRGDNIILASFGAGYTWGSLWLRWAIERTQV
ncbi:MAG: beta-ketoacyl-ACP synthase III [Bacteroidota bacterium]|nr:ketoacyl-ACP synthase III [Candidatus Kapabacteria bacterium]MCS7302004.1 ketoacyl-ACP synthase III [Candidatus Kapabacteria bacterium]MCX7936804.1 ketoacyl-ACP synthase III [Chlorobiota bacterium]MDW8074523.1 beta-ketoacyl-ACP synthase III [Bacteroidota bacterium]MDW8271001.1 beta-ketoacyl-ACP synthase III [Bacteroidota bacterium]